MKRPLIVRLCNWVGEVVLAVPGLLALEEAGYELHLIGKKWAPSLLAGHGWTVHARPGKRSHAIAQMRALKRCLAQTDPDFSSRPNIVLLTNSFSSALEARLAGLRPVGAAGEGRRFLLSKSIARQSGIHAAAQYRRVTDLLSGDVSLDDARLKVSNMACAQADTLLAQYQVPRPFVILCPFSGAADTTGKKQWPDFPGLAALIGASGYALLLCPGPGEESQAQEGYADASIIAGVDLGTYAALLKKAAYAVSNDTGPGHIAAAVGCHVISVYGPGSIQAWSPVGPAVSLLIRDGRWPTLEEVWAQIQRDTGGMV